MKPDDELDSVYIRDAVDRIRAGDTVAKNELIRKAQNRLERLARKMLKTFPGVGRWEQTQDVFQNAVMRLLRALELVRPDNRREFFGLAAEQIRRELIDMARRHQGPHGLGANFESVYGKSDANTEDTVDPLDTSDRAPTNAELDRWLAFHEAVELLPVKEREVIGLTYYHGWTQVQIADLFQIDERTVRRRFQSACDALRLQLGGDLPA